MLGSITKLHKLIKMASFICLASFMVVNYYYYFFLGRTESQSHCTALKRYMI